MANHPSIACKDCGHVNEAERVYCHNCGVKLDRGQLVEASANKETAEKEQRRVRRMLNPNEGKRTGKWVKGTVLSILLGAVAAALINAARPPEKVPEIPEVAQARPLAEMLGRLVASPTNVRLVLKESDINDFLRTSIRPKEKEKGAIRFVRVYTTLDQEGVNIAMQRQVFGYPFHVGRRYGVAIEQGQLKVTPLGGYAGRLKLPKELDPLFESTFKTIWDTMRQEYALLGRVGALRLEDGQVSLYAKPIATSRGPVTPAATGEGPAASTTPNEADGAPAASSP